MQRLPVGMDVDAIRQTAHNEYIGASQVQFLDEPADQILPVDGAFAGAYNIDDTPGIEVGRAFIIEHQWRIVALAQPLGVTVVGRSEHLNAVALVVLQLFRSSAEGIVEVAETLFQLGWGIGDDILDMVSMVDDGGGTA